jgi:hypothetical protein
VLDGRWLLNGANQGQIRNRRNVAARRGEYRSERQDNAVVVVNRRSVTIPAIVGMDRVRRGVPVTNKLVVPIECARFMNVLRGRERQDRDRRSKQS